MNTSIYLSNLTPLRGIAAVLVVIYHGNMFLMPIIDKSLTHYMENGFLWVDFFFVLSGFILSHVYSAGFRSSVTKSAYKQYLLARFARIYPLYFFTLVWAIGAILLIRAHVILPDELKSMFNLRAIPTSLLLLPASPWHNFASLNGPAWSLCTEWWMYLIFPWLCPLVFTWKTRGKLAAFSLVLSLYLLLVYYLVPVFGTTARPPAQLPPTLDIVGDFSLLRCLAGFLLGMLVYDLYRHRWGQVWLQSGWVLGLIFSGMLSAMHVGLNPIGIVLLSALLVLAASYSSGRVHRLLASRPFQSLGNWSFSIYMVHAPLMLTYFAFLGMSDTHLLVKPKPAGPPDYALGWLVVGMYVLLTLLLSALTYRFIEVPARSYLNARLGTLRQEPMAVAL